MENLGNDRTKTEHDRTMMKPYGKMIDQMGTTIKTCQEKYGKFRKIYGNMGNMWKNHDSSG